MKKVILFLLIIVLSFGTISCKKKPIESKVNISVTTSFSINDVAGAEFRVLVDNFISNNPNITVTEATVKADDAWKAAIRSQFEVGQEPDVLFFYTAADAKQMIDNNQFVSISTIRKKYPKYCSNIRNESLEAVREFDDNIYAIPVRGFWEALFCNTELFEKYNVPPITDWNSLINAIKIFKENDITPIAASFADVPNYWIEHTILSAGGRTDHSKNPTSKEEIPQSWRDGLNLLKQLYDMGAFQSDSLVNRHDLSSVSLYNNGGAAMILDGSWMQLNENLASKSSIARVPFLDTIPEQEQAVVSGFTMGFYITTKAWNNPEKRDACVKFVEHITSNKSVAALSKSGLPAAELENFNDFSQVGIQGIELVNSNRIQLPIDSRLNKGAWEYLLAMIPDILSNKVDIDTVLNNLVEKNSL